MILFFNGKYQWFHVLCYSNYILEWYILIAIQNISNIRYFLCLQFFAVNKAFTSKQLNLALGIRPSPIENAKVEKQQKGKQIDVLFMSLSYSFFLIWIWRKDDLRHVEFGYILGFFFPTKQELSVKIDFYLNGTFIVFERFLSFSEWK